MANSFYSHVLNYVNKFSRHYNLEDKKKKRNGTDTRPCSILYKQVVKEIILLTHQEMNFQQMSHLNLVIIYKHIIDLSHNYGKINQKC